MNSKHVERIEVLAWGTYDLGKPRTRLTLKALADAGYAVSQVHRPIWTGVEDKSTLGSLRFLGFLLKVLLAYPLLIFRFFLRPRPDVVLILYPGHLDVLILGLFAKIRGVPIVWDVFISAYDTVVDDRQLISPNSAQAKILRWFEGLACKMANHLVLDTQAQAAYFRRHYKRREDQVSAVPVGAEGENFQPKSAGPPATSDIVLFYGQFIPLHGVDTIIEAAKLTEDLPIAWKIIGTGQMKNTAQRQIETLAPANLHWTEWVPYEDLIDEIAKAGVCLGIFGNSEKAGRVVPNKVYQILTAGRPLVTRDGPAIRELIPTDVKGIELVEAANPHQLADAVTKVLAQSSSDDDLHTNVKERFSPQLIASLWSDIIGSQTKQ